MQAHKLPSMRTAVVALVTLISLAIIPYLPFFSLSHISDDYLQIELGRTYGRLSGWNQLAGDALYRCRATSILLTNWTEQLFGVSPAAFRAQSVLMHAMNTLLIAWLGAWRLVGWKLAVVAAGFFAVYEGHQEAVVWHAASPELLVFFFALLALHAWIHWLESGPRAGMAYGAAMVCFLLALFSKESGVATVPLLAGAGYLSQQPFACVLKALAPFAAISVLYASAIFTAQDTHLHLNDGTFAPSAAVAEVVARSSFRLLWIWGLAAVGFLAIRGLASGRLVGGAAAWMVITLLPYSFLSYMPYVPSRHLYWASAGLAFLVAGALTKLWNSGPQLRRVAVAAATTILIQNCSYLWLKKYPQYERRAAPTERLITFSQGVKGRIIVKCFPYTAEVAVLALQVRTGRPAASTIWDPKAAPGPGVYCDGNRP